MHQAGFRSESAEILPHSQCAGGQDHALGLAPDDFLHRAGQVIDGGTQLRAAIFISAGKADDVFFGLILQQRPDGHGHRLQISRWYAGR